MKKDNLEKYDMGKMISKSIMDMMFIVVEELKHLTKKEFLNKYKRVSSKEYDELKSKVNKERLKKSNMIKEMYKYLTNEYGIFLVWTIIIIFLLFLVGGLIKW